MLSHNSAIESFPAQLVLVDLTDGRRSVVHSDPAVGVAELFGFAGWLSSAG